MQNSRASAPTDANILLASPFPWGVTMSWSGFLKFFTGLFLAIAILAGGGFLTAQYFIAKLSTPPPKPTFPNDKPSSPTRTASSSRLKPASTEKPDTSDPSASPKPLPAGAFEGRVTQPIGLILRDAPGRDSGQIGGIDYNDKVTVLETSADGDWQKVKLQPSDREGWVKAGNIEKLGQ
jgi:Bacterial SH3 domain